MKTPMVLLTYAALTGLASASSCGERVKALRARYDAKPLVIDEAPLGGTAAAETSGARLHHQPTSESVPTGIVDPLSSLSVRDARFRLSVLAAKAAAESNDERGCEAALRTAKAAYEGR